MNGDLLFMYERYKAAIHQLVGQWREHSSFVRRRHSRFNARVILSKMDAMAATLGNGYRSAGQWLCSRLCRVRDSSGSPTIFVMMMRMAEYMCHPTKLAVTNMNVWVLDFDELLPE